jgi:hypothetical protein
MKFNKIITLSILIFAISMKSVFAWDGWANNGEKFTITETSIQFNNANENNTTFTGGALSIKVANYDNLICYYFNSGDLLEVEKAKGLYAALLYAETNGKKVQLLVPAQYTTFTSNSSNWILFKGINTTN